MLERHHPDRFRVYASASIADFPKTDEEAKSRLRKVEILDKTKAIAKVNGTPIDYSWLKGASETYQISPNIMDYIISSVPIVTVDFPNRNGHAFSFDETSYFDPRFGTFIYKTFVGKPVFADHCFPAGTMIQTIEGLKSIEKIEIGDQALTHNLRFRPVTEVFKNGNKKLTKIKIQGVMEILEATDNHPILVVDRRQVFGKYDDNYQIYRKRLRKDDFRINSYKPHFRPISDVYVGDYAVIPINYGGSITADKSLAFLVGAYLADGCFTSKKEAYPDGGCLLFTIGNHEVDFRNAIMDHAQKLGYNPKYRPLQTPGCDWIMINSSAFCSYIKSVCGEYSEHKRIMGELRQWDVETTKILLGGYMSGDGCFDSKKGSFRVRTSSKNLLTDLQQAYAFVGIPACVGTDFRMGVHKRKPNKLGIDAKNDSNYLRISQFFIPEIQNYVVGKNISPAASKADSGRGIINDKYLMMPILKIERDSRTADVFNLEIEEDHTYVAGGIVVHNCNKVFTEAKGVHFDSTLKYVPGWNVWKINVLLGYDRSKDSTLARQIEKGQRRSYSMGAWVSYFLNSLTGQLSNGNQPLKYPKGTIHNGVLSYDMCSGVEFFECLSLNTLVKTSSGDCPIQNLKTGDFVFDEFGSSIEIVRTFENGKKRIVDLCSVNGQTLASCTEEHRWLTATGEVKKVKDFSENELLKHASGTIAVRIDESNVREEFTFDIHVNSKTNLYQLTSGLITHNTSSVIGPADVTAESHQLWLF